MEPTAVDCSACYPSYPGGTLSATALAVHSVPDIVYRHFHDDLNIILVTVGIVSW